MTEMTEKFPFRIAGDTIYDWIVKDGETRFAVGGVGNLCRGLMHYGIDVSLTTVYNPLFAAHKFVPMADRSIADTTHNDVSLRDYDIPVYERTWDPRCNRFNHVTVEAVVCHKDSCIKSFDAFYADVRDPKQSGICQVLRMSSTDDWRQIMENIAWSVAAIVTYPDKIIVFAKSDYFKFEDLDPNVQQAVFILPEPYMVVDTVGAGDCFNVGFIREMHAHQGSTWQDHLIDYIRAGAREARNKVAKVGVFFDW